MRKRKHEFSDIKINYRNVFSMKCDQQFGVPQLINVKVLIVEIFSLNFKNKSLFVCHLLMHILTFIVKKHIHQRKKCQLFFQN